VKLDTYRSIETPEGVELGLRVASPLPRALAWLADLVMRLMVYAIAGALLGLAGGVGGGVWFILVFCVEWGWAVGFEVLGGGASPGKRLLGLMVVRADGTPVGWSESILRNLLRPADFVPAFYGIGLIACLASADFQRLGDRVAGTLVVHRERRPRSTPLPKVEPVSPPLALSVEEQAALVEFASRVKGWTPARSIEIADRLTPLTGASGEPGVRAVLGLARWAEGQK
jgi:uncharacterized RDD family membrane protein YckC